MESEEADTETYGDGVGRWPAAGDLPPSGVRAGERSPGGPDSAPRGSRGHKRRANWRFRLRIFF